MISARVKVAIRCNMWGEKFVLRGRREKDKIDTGFKQCLCNNIHDFDVEEIAL